MFQQQRSAYAPLDLEDQATSNNQSSFAQPETYTNTAPIANQQHDYNHQNGNNNNNNNSSSSSSYGYSYSNSGSNKGIIRVEAIPDTIRPPQVIESEDQVPPSTLKRVAIFLCGFAISFTIFLYDVLYFVIYEKIHERWVEFLGFLETVVLFSFVIGTGFGVYHGRWSALVPGFVIFKAVQIMMIIIWHYELWTNKNLEGSLSEWEK